MNEFAPLITQTIDGWDFVWRCRICYKDFKTYSEAVEHLKTEHPYEVASLHWKGDNDKVWNPTKREE